MTDEKSLRSRITIRKIKADDEVLLIRQRMGMKPMEFMFGLSALPPHMSKNNDLQKPYIWPKHTNRELNEFGNPVYQYGPDEPNCLVPEDLNKSETLLVPDIEPKNVPDILPDNVQTNELSTQIRNNTPGPSNISKLTSTEKIHRDDSSTTSTSEEENEDKKAKTKNTHDNSFNDRSKRKSSHQLKDYEKPSKISKFSGKKSPNSSNIKDSVKKVATSQLSSVDSKSSIQLDVNKNKESLHKLTPNKLEKSQINSSSKLTDGSGTPHNQMKQESTNRIGNGHVIKTPNIAQILEQTSCLLKNHEKVYERDAVSPLNYPIPDVDSSIDNIPRAQNQLNLTPVITSTSNNALVTSSSFASNKIASNERVKQLKEEKEMIQTTLNHPFFIQTVTPLNPIIKKKLLDNFNMSDDRDSLVHRIKLMLEKHDSNNSVHSESSIQQSSFSALIFIPNKSDQEHSNESLDKNTEFVNSISSIEKVTNSRSRVILKSSLVEEQTKENQFRLLGATSWQEFCAYINQTTSTKTSNCPNSDSKTDFFNKYPMTLPSFVCYAENMLLTIKSLVKSDENKRILSATYFKFYRYLFHQAYLSEHQKKCLSKSEKTQVYLRLLELLDLFDNRLKRGVSKLQRRSERFHDSVEKSRELPGIKWPVAVQLIILRLYAYVSFQIHKLKSETTLRQIDSELQPLNISFDQVLRSNAKSENHKNDDDLDNILMSAQKSDLKKLLKSSSSYTQYLVQAESYSEQAVRLSAEFQSELMPHNKSKCEGTNSLESNEDNSLITFPIAFDFNVAFISRYIDMSIVYLKRLVSALAKATEMLVPKPVNPTLPSVSPSKNKNDKNLIKSNSSVSSLTVSKRFSEPIQIKPPKRLPENEKPSNKLNEESKNVCKTSNLKPSHKSHKPSSNENLLHKQKVTLPQESKPSKHGSKHLHENGHELGHGTSTSPIVKAEKSVHSPEHKKHRKSEGSKSATLHKAKSTPTQFMDWIKKSASQAK